MFYRFLLTNCDPTTLTIPNVAAAQADTVTDAVAQFERKHGMKVDYVKNGEAWLTLKDGATVRYLVNAGDER